MPLLAVSTNCHNLHSGLGRMTSFHPRRDLGILNDADLSMRSHVQRTVAGCFAVLRQLCSVGRSVPSFVFQTLIVSLVLMKLDFGNATLAGLPTYLLNHFQSVLNAAARSIAGLRRSVTSLTLLPVFTGFVLLSASISNWRSLYRHGTAPRYLSDPSSPRWCMTCRLVVVYGRRSVRFVKKTLGGRRKARGSRRRRP